MQPEVYPAPYVITETDRRGLIVVIVATTFSFVWTCLLIKSWLSWKTREWKSDDYILAAATIFDTIQSALVFRLVNEGFGTSQESLSQSDLNRIGKIDFASQILYIFTLLISKCAVLFLYLRLSPEKGHKVASWATIALSSAWAICSIVLIAVPCDPIQFWKNGPEQCSNIWPRWQAIGAIDIITEGAIFLIAIYLVAPLHMRMRSKVTVLTAFSARLPAIVACACRLYYLHSTLYSTDRTLEGTYYVVATQWHLGYAIMSTTITGLGPFLRPFSKSFSASYKHSSYAHHPSEPGSSMGDSQTKSGIHSRSVSYQMQPLPSRHYHAFSSTEHTSSAVTASGPSSTHDHGLTLRPDSDTFKRNIAVTGGDRTPSTRDEEDGVSTMSHESQQWIIKKKTELTVELDQASRVSRHGGN